MYGLEAHPGWWLRTPEFVRLVRHIAEEGAIMRNTVRLGTIFGIELKLDYSWFIIFVLITWSLAGHYFPGAHPGWSSGAYWALGALTSALFFASVVIHELAHSLVSRAFGTPVHDITLFIFGGAAHISQEPRRAREDLWMALAGPTASLGLAALFYALWWLSLGVAGPLHALAGWLGWINLVLALFNLIPGFPLDGGRVLRAIIWGATGDLRRATQIAAGVGRLVAFGFIFWGIWQIFGGNWADGLWIAFIGWFLDSAATRSVQQLAVQDLLTGHTVREAMLTDCPHVPRRLTLDVLVDQVAAASGRRCFPVMEGEQVYGLLTLQRITDVPHARWPDTRAEDVMIPRSALKTVRPDDELTTVLERMTDEDVNQFPVIDDGRWLGMVSRDTLLSFLRARAARTA
jgi:Zn-dependent protease/CBS domain-containing protein